MFLPKLLPLPDYKTPLLDLNTQFIQLMPHLWCKGTGQRFNKDMYACWVYQNRGTKQNNASPTPRINRRNDTGNPHSTIRRYMASLFFDLDAHSKVFIVMRCRNRDCVNPRHFLFFDHPRPNLRKILNDDRK